MEPFQQVASDNNSVARVGPAAKGTTAPAATTIAGLHIDPRSMRNSPTLSRSKCLRHGAMRFCAVALGERNYRVGNRSQLIVICL
jgi:hypothetical protein